MMDMSGLSTQKEAKSGIGATKKQDNGFATENLTQIICEPISRPFDKVKIWWVDCPFGM